MEMDTNIEGEEAAHAAAAGINQLEMPVPGIAEIMPGKPANEQRTGENRKNHSLYSVARGSPFLFVVKQRENNNENSKI